MKEILEVIEKKQKEFSEIPFFTFLKDRNITPHQRLSFTPVFAPFVMGFGELNRSVWREEPASDPIQVIVNQHTREDDSHWIWFLEDIQKLEFNLSLDFTEALNFLWSDKTESSRHTIYELYRLTYRVSGIQKLAAIEAIEAIAELFFTGTTQVVQEIQTRTEQDYRYFGLNHLSADTTHTMHSLETETLIENLQLTTQEREEALKRVESVFSIFTNFFDFLMDYAQSNQVDEFMYCVDKRELLHTTINQIIPVKGYNPKSLRRGRSLAAS